jgi:glutamate-1-semialdehyde 2,1-aminomutase
MINVEHGRSTDVLRKAGTLFPGGSLGTYVMPPEQAFAVSHGSGSKLFGLDGREYLDFVIGSGPMLLGHAHPDVTAAVVEQAARGTQFYWFTEQIIELAELMVDAIPCAEMIKFCSTGGEATFYALRLARSFTGRDKILRFAGAYHGHHDYGMAGSTTGVPSEVSTTVVTAPFNDLDETRACVHEHADELAAIIVEPLQRVVAAEPGFLPGLRDLADESGAVLIFDEVVTGFRLAWGGAQEKHGVTPDLATYAKVIGGGLPLAAVAGRGAILEHSNPNRGVGDYAYVSGTLNGNPLAAAAGVASLKVLRDTDAYARLGLASDRLRAGLQQIASKLRRQLHVLGDGGVFGLAFSDADPTDPVAVAQGDKAVLRRIEGELLRAGIFANVPAKLYTSVAHTVEDIDRALEVMGTVIPACAEGRE